jgi:hypothetical protein
MLVTITNATSEQRPVTMLYRSLDAGESITVSRPIVDLMGERQFLLDVEAGYLTLAFADEAGDSAKVGSPGPFKAFANAAALPAVATRPLYYPVWQTDAFLPVWNDGTNWRRADGSITV